GGPSTQLTQGRVYTIGGVSAPEVIADVETPGTATDASSRSPYSRFLCLTQSKIELVKEIKNCGQGPQLRLLSREDENQSAGYTIATRRRPSRHLLSYCFTGQVALEMALYVRDKCLALLIVNVILILMS
ncbi:hypothetical protein Dimus_030114, partial [Dionaea muscipula]